MATQEEQRKRFNDIQEKLRRYGQERFSDIEDDDSDKDENLDDGRYDDDAEELHNDSLPMRTAAVPQIPNNPFHSTTTRSAFAKSTYKTPLSRIEEEGEFQEEYSGGVTIRAKNLDTQRAVEMTPTDTKGKAIQRQTGLKPKQAIPQNPMDNFCVGEGLTRRVAAKWQKQQEEAQVQEEHSTSREAAMTKENTKLREANSRNDRRIKELEKTANDWEYAALVTYDSRWTGITSNTRI